MKIPFYKNGFYKIIALLFVAVILPVFLSDAQTRIAIEKDIADAVLSVPDKSNDTEKWNGTLVGGETGLYSIEDGKCIQLWSEGAVHKIIRAKEWIFLTTKGIVASKDLSSFEYRNAGLPTIMMKKYEGGKTSFENEQVTLLDLQIHPANPEIMVTLTRDSVFLTRDSGHTWKSLSFPAKTDGAKAVCVADMPEVSNDTAVPGKENLTVFMSHSIYGLSYIQPDVAKAKWTDVTAGFAVMPTQSYPDEISDIIAVRRAGENGMVSTELYLGNSFMQNIYRFDWEKKRAVLIGDGTAVIPVKGAANSAKGASGPKEMKLDSADSLFAAGNKLIFLRRNGFGSFDLETNTFTGEPSEASVWRYLAELPGPSPRSIFIPAEASGFGQAVSLSELWFLNFDKHQDSYAEISDGKRALYVPAGQAIPGPKLQGFIDTIKQNGLNAIVIDMKDDYGLLRYKSQDKKVIDKASESQYALDIDAFVKQCKDNDIYLIARIVVFKDRNLWKYDGGKYAVWDYSTGSQWRGYKGEKEVVDANGNVTGKEADYYDEYWVDPYCEDVWAYNVEIAKDLIAHKFDEIQFDYIRFPTDGRNLSKASFRWRDKGLTKESALLSFLAYARQNIDVPIGIDIYGANGWYRSGARTGQDVELLSRYVNVICPMFYPSHFEQDFLAHSPAIERPYRVYYYGSYRNTVIARNNVLVRPWIQAFYLPVSYDKRYYDAEYVRREVIGVRDSVDNGYMYWNNSGRYGDVYKDVN